MNINVYATNYIETVSGNGIVSGNTIIDDKLKYEDVLDLILELEIAATEYINLSKNKDNYNPYNYDRDTLVYTYIRGVRYCSSSWNALGGRRDLIFDKYILEKKSKYKKIKRNR